MMMMMEVHVEKTWKCKSLKGSTSISLSFWRRNNIKGPCQDLNAL